MNHALIALGSNLGDREKTIRAAWKRLGEEPSIQTLQMSSIREYPPFGGIEQPHFLNAAGTILTPLSPEGLLDRLLTIEKEFGRVRLVHWGPRTLDLDLIFYEQEIIQTERLIVPHPGLIERDFVLEPAVEIAPSWIHPLLGISLSEILKKGYERGFSQNNLSGK